MGEYPFVCKSAGGILQQKKGLSLLWLGSTRSKVELRAMDNEESMFGVSSGMIGALEEIDH